MDNRREWNTCDAFAHHVSDEGRERVVFCNKERHDTPGGTDTDLDHYDPDLEIVWHYADE